MEVQYLLDDFESLLKDVQDDDLVGVIYGASLLVFHLGREYPTRANAYVARIFRALPKLRLPAGVPVEPPLGAEPEKLLWITASGIRSGEDLADWLNTAEQLPLAERSSLFHSDISYTRMLLLCDGTWDRERQKAPEQQDWHSVLDQLEAIDKFAVSCGFTTLRGAVARARIIVHSEFRNSINGAVAVAGHAYSALGEDPKAQFLIAQSIGLQFSRHHEQTDDTRLWAQRAVAASTEAFPLLRRDVLLLLSRIELQNQPARGIEFAEQAGLRESGNKLSMYGRNRYPCFLASAQNRPIGKWCTLSAGTALRILRVKRTLGSRQRLTSSNLTRGS
jgi:hypothetical protein